MLPSDWLIQSEIAGYWQWCHIWVTSDDIISLLAAGILKTPGYWWHHLLVPICQVRPGLDSGHTLKFDWQYWGIKPHPLGSTTRYQLTKLTCWSSKKEPENKIKQTTSRKNYSATSSIKQIQQSVIKQARFSK